MTANAGSLRADGDADRSHVCNEMGQAMTLPGLRTAGDGIPVAVACRVLNTSRSGFYDWPGRPEPPRELRN
jgi:hypothetical protein